MTSDRALRLCMQVLVLLNLVFVQMTGAAELRWLLPLYGLALGAPLLERYRETLLHRLLWNVGVVCFFLVLLRHVLASDLAYLLQDGLVLAVLCQVHLLNNLRSTQRPDLLFFNAFLIAVMTGFLNRGLGFPLAFLAFAPCFVVGLQLLGAARAERVLPPSVTRRLLVDGARRAGILLALTLLVFLFWPRDFERKAFFHGRIELTSGGPQELEIGFARDLDLGRRGEVGSATRPSLRVSLLEGARADVPPLWRGATLGSTSGGAWYVMERALRRATAPADVGWLRRTGRLVRPDSPPAAGANGPRAASVRVEVVRFEEESERVFAPLGARELRLAPEHARRALRPRPDGTAEVAGAAEVRYQLGLAPPPLRRGGPPEPDLPPELAPFVELPASERIDLARDLAARLVERLPAGTEQHEIVARLSHHLGRTHGYLPPGAEGGPSSLDEFLRDGSGGHCEFFASALATMLRSLGIPCRVVTGYRSTRWDPTGRVLSFETRDAHAWVEVHDPRAGWYAVDPTPPAAEGVAGAGLWARLRSGARSAWEVVTAFDSDRRAALLARLRTVPGRAGSLLRERPLAAALATLALALPAALLALRLRARTDPRVRSYESALRRAHQRLRPGETPRELLERARAQGLTPSRLHALETATRRHEAARYAA